MKKFAILLLFLATTAIFSFSYCGCRTMVSRQPDLPSYELEDIDRPVDERRGFRQLEREFDYLEFHVGEIVYIDYHYVYCVVFKDGHKKCYDGYQTKNACGIWAVRRKLRHMAFKGQAQKDAWIKLSDAQVRNILVSQSIDGHEMVDSHDKADTEGTGILPCEAVVNLQRFLGVPQDKCKVISYHNSCEKPIYYVLEDFIPKGYHPMSSTKMDGSADVPISPIAGVVQVVHD
ncbi:MAG: hypothetical protein LBD17_06435 [Endomicrobium sp.]|jgi:hypothetical protein|nr:hypothetical protein [Endomicrobium sp.]